MSQPSQSSQNYQNIVHNFLDCKKQWQQVPQIVYLTVRALFNHTQIIQEDLYRQKQFMAEQSIRVKELSIQIQDLANRNEILQMDQISNLRQSAFKKSKKSNKPKSERMGGRSQSSKRPRGQYTFSNSKEQHESIIQDKSLSYKMIQEIRSISEQIVRNKLKQAEGKLVQINNIKAEFENNIQKNGIKIEKEIKICKEEISELLNTKNRQLEKQFSLKAQSERGSIMRFIEQSALQTEKIWIQINSIHVRLGQIVKESKQCYSNPVFIHKQDQKTDRNIKQKQTIKFKDYSNEGKVLELFSNLSKQFSEFKLKTIKELTQFMKTDHVEAMLGKYQTESSQKIIKFTKTILNLQKQVQNIKRQAPKVPKEDKNDFKKVKSSQQNLLMIQQSLQNLQNYFKQKLKSFKKEINLLIESNIDKQQTNLKKQLREQLQFRQKTLCDIVQTNCDRISHIQQKPSSNDDPLRKIVEKLSEQMILTRYLHLGHKQCKEAIQWEKNVYNSMQDNFLWKNHHIITVLSAGLYRLQVGLYPDNQVDKVQAYVILNDIPISALKKKQAPASCEAPARGSLFNEAILLPGKSKIWIKVDSPFFGQAYLQILKL